MSPRESLSPFRNSPNTAAGVDTDVDIKTFPFQFGKTPAQMTHEGLLALAGKLSPSALRLESPLDLSVPRKRAADALLEVAQAQEKIVMDINRLSAWGLPLAPHIASAMLRQEFMAGLKPDFNIWNTNSTSESSPISPFALGLGSPTPSAAAKALERMSELSRRGAAGNLATTTSADFLRSGIGGLNASVNSLNSGGGSSSGARTNAWQSHWLSKGQDATRDVLKCVWCKASYSSLAELTTHMKEAKHCGVSLPPPSTSMASSIPPNRTPNVKHLSSAHTTSNSTDHSSANIKETMTMPRKLVRGQDVWLGKGAEQTKQILKCMWCGQSFKTLADMTRHMQQTQHYTNIISQEQIISWKSPEEKAASEVNVNAVLTCKVCDEAFSSLKELTNHMVKYAHYKEHVMRSLTETGSRRRQSREKRKKSLPVRKLLELERAQHDMKMTEGNMKSRDNSKIVCDKCGKKIDSIFFINHIRACSGNREEPLAPSMLSPSSYSNGKPDKSYDSDCDNRKKSEKPNQKRSQIMETDRDNKDSLKQPSVLNALENLIEKSFNTKKSKPGSSSPLGASILRRLGIDESTDYSKPLMEPSMMYNSFSQMQSPLSAPGSSTLNFPYNTEMNFGQCNESFTSLSEDSDTHDSFNRSPARPYSRPASNSSEVREGSEKSLDMSRPELPSSMMEQSMDVDNNIDQSDNESETYRSKKLQKFLENAKNITRQKTMPLSQTKNVHENNEKDRTSVTEIKKEPGTENHNNIPGEDRKEEIRVRNDIQVNGQFNIRSNSHFTYNPIKEEIPVVSELRDRILREEINDRKNSSEETMRNSPGTTGSRSGIPHSEPGSMKGVSSGGLSALAGIFGTSNKIGGSVNPLAALQKLCDKTENTPRQQPPTSHTTQANTQGSILALSLADEVGGENIIKCAYCEVPFVSKGAYRHHLCKVHFVTCFADEKQVNDSNNASHNGNSTNSSSAFDMTGCIKDNNTCNNNDGEMKLVIPVSPQAPLEDSPYSKFLKYTELAKQLSSK